ncbi:MAG: class I SAM-dependent methyltransferase [Acholeplasmatales bacterium]|jgi:hypothetical protein|nr:class I SAM-dependent methyltransferase [Acholeplasmatales bacterium]
MKLMINDVLKSILLNLIDRDSIVVNASTGNGLETIFLAEHVKKVYAFSTQELAISNTKYLTIENKITNCVLLKESRDNINKHVNKYQGVLYNLGYLPLDEPLEIRLEKTINSIKGALEVIPKSGGFICVSCYPGVKYSKEEISAIHELLINLPLEEYDLLKFNIENKASAPYVLLLVKL